tara:strand:- start:72 stop:599 length:528 start_codon:yes stop_codon:yes gene_type:complete
MSLTAEVLFINADYLKRFTHVNGSVEEAYIQPSVMLAQDKYIQSFLGTDLFNKLKTDIAASSLAGDYITLMNSHVRRVTLWWTMLELVPRMHVRLDNGGLVIRVSEDSQPITKGDLNRELDLARQNAQFYTDRMIDYLCENSSLFPEYSSNSADDIKPEKKAYYVAGMEISVGNK